MVSPAWAKAAPGVWAARWGSCILHVCPLEKKEQRGGVCGFSPEMTILPSDNGRVGTFQLSLSIMDFLSGVPVFFCDIYSLNP